MTDYDTRLAAIKNLLEDEKARVIRRKWESLLDDKSLTPETHSAVFQKQLYDLLITEMEEGYLRNDQVRREKRKKTGKFVGYIPPQMRINSPLGRFLFAYFKWHDVAALSPKTKIKPHGLRDIAEAFEFRIDPAENDLQFLKAEERLALVNKENDRGYYRWIWKMMLGGFTLTILIILVYFRRRGGLWYVS